MQVETCKKSGMEVSPKTHNACTFQIIDEWDSEKYPKTSDSIFLLRNGTGAYVWECDHWTFLDFAGTGVDHGTRE